VWLSPTDLTGYDKIFPNGGRIYIFECFCGGNLSYRFPLFYVRGAELPSPDLFLVEYFRTPGGIYVWPPKIDKSFLYTPITG
jgi:GTP-dependent phosphoenolpyruvate carboxykinase